MTTNNTEFRVGDLVRYHQDPFDPKYLERIIEIRDENLIITQTYLQITNKFGTYRETMYWEPEHLRLVFRKTY